MSSDRRIRSRSLGVIGTATAGASASVCAAASAGAADAGGGVSAGGVWASAGDASAARAKRPRQMEYRRRIVMVGSFQAIGATGSGIGRRPGRQHALEVDPCFTVER